jgi:hypothetical protein
VPSCACRWSPIYARNQKMIRTAVRGTTHEK